MLQSGVLSVVIPAKNEALAIESLIVAVRRSVPDAEIIVVDDGSADNTRVICEKAGVLVISHPYPKGNGAAIKTGARHATGKYIVFLDGDGQHDPDDIDRLYEKILHGYELVIGARSETNHASGGRRWANALYNRLSSWVSGHTIPDLTSGFRMVNAKRFREFLYLLPNGFSYPTTSTMAFLRAGYSVGFVPIEVKSRQGKSHIRPLKDGIRFLLIIFKIGTLYSPLKLFTPVSATLAFFGMLHYAYNYIHYGRFSNMSAFLFISSVIVFMLGLVSEQITSLIYANTKPDD